MSAELLAYVSLAFGLSAALVGGVFQSFSDFVMQGLARAEPAGGISSMQGLNRTVYRSWFLRLFLALAPASIGFAIYALVALDGPARGWIIAAAFIYVPLVFLVTVAGNVPMNNRLDALDPHGAEGEQYWLTYLRDWTRLNTVRTWGSIAAAGAYLMAAVAV